jgi:DMSO/TMAO reductase YedYZ molybdopterin-dependent catalytic subunit
MSRPLPTAMTKIIAWGEAASGRPARDNRAAALLGALLGMCFIVCFATGIYSHIAQHPVSWFAWRSRPAGLYRVTQGLHVATGIASVPLLFAKLWAVFPRLFRWPIADNPLHAIERLMLLPLVGGSLFMLITGVANIELWYPWVFFFPAGHYSVAWIVVGALIIHGVARFGSSRVAFQTPGNELRTQYGLTRRGFLSAVGLTSTGLVAVTAGQSFSPLRRLALLAPRRPDIGTQGFPVNKTAVEAGVVDAISLDDYRLTVVLGNGDQAQFTLEQLRALPVHSATLPIACVEGWSANSTWTGVRVSDVLRAAAGVEQPPKSDVQVESVQRGGRYRSSVLNARHVADGDTLLAMEVNGEALHPDHGFPLRLIAPNRPGVLQTKWVSTLRVIA